MSINFKKLTETMPHKIKVQTANEWNCNCVAYVDARQVQDKLDDVVGPNNWQTKYETIGNQLFCHLGIWDNDKSEWVWKSDTGTESMAEKEKGMVSDAFKRAAVQWGVGRFLYSLGIKKTKSMKDNRGKWVPADSNGKRIWDLTKHFKSDAKVDSVANEVQQKVANATPAVDPNKTDSTTPNGRYDASKGGSNVKYVKSNISDSTMSRITELNRDGKTGKAVLVDYIAKYNEANDTKLSATDLTSDDVLIKILDFIDSVPPSNI